MLSLKRNQSLKSADPHPDDQMDEEDLWGRKTMKLATSDTQV
jgi:hypothetical protein